MYKSKNILTLVTIEYIVGFIVDMYIEYCLCAQVAVLNHKLLYWTVWDMFMQVLYLGRAPRTKETLPDFREKCRVTRHSRVFRGLKGSQRAPEIGVSLLRIGPLMSWERPKSVFEIRSFLGLAGYYRRFIEDFSRIAAPMTRLTRKDVKFDWDDRCEEAFQ